MPQIDHRPRSVSELIDTAFALLRRDYGRYCLIVAAVTAPWQVARLGAVHLTNADFSNPANFDLGAMAVVGSIALLFLALTEAAVAYAVARAYQGERVAVGDALRAGLRRWWPVLGAMLLKYLLIAALAIAGISVTFIASLVVVFATHGFSGDPTDPVLMVVVAITMIVGLAAIVPAVGRYAAVPLTAALEPLGPVASMRRSRELTRGLWKHAVGVSALAWAVVAVPAIGASLLATLLGSQIVEQAVGVVTTVLLTPVYVASLTALYFDLRIRKEGYDLEMMASRLAAAEPDAGPDLPAARGA